MYTFKNLLNLLSWRTACDTVRNDRQQRIKINYKDVSIWTRCNYIVNVLRWFLILLLRNNYISYGAWFVFGPVDSHKTFSNKLNSNRTMIFLFTIFLTYTYTDTFDHYAQNLLKIFPFFAYWYMCTIASSSYSSWKIIHQKFYTWINNKTH